MARIVTLWAATRRLASRIVILLRINVNNIAWHRRTPRIWLWQYGELLCEPGVALLAYAMSFARDTRYDSLLRLCPDIKMPAARTFSLSLCLSLALSRAGLLYMFQRSKPLRGFPLCLPFHSTFPRGMFRYHRLQKEETMVEARVYTLVCIYSKVIEAKRAWRAINARDCSSKHGA